MLVVYRAISMLVEILELLILVRIIFSWFGVSPYNPIARIVYDLTEPLLSLARNLIYKIGINTGIFDFSPIVAILMLRIILSITRAIIY